MFVPSSKKAIQITHRASTALAALAFAIIGTADLVHAPRIMEGITHLGYPTYVATILGTWQILGAAAILAPGLPRVKEWAYAGMFFLLTGAALSHLASGDRAGVLVPILLLGAVTVSWRLGQRESWPRAERRDRVLNPGGANARFDAPPL